ncbi:hypothetical protein IW261DRAFT_1565477 [Armillaria novae-zelandiae]|uniref:DUF6697 domain-containing protein n=1 Tax=Armillaria novae-zelandiae TaxID=153914 RepID=A0AA39P6J4_9AGAR|nr:hypothetical protein IW261DRAFT_1565477 [Armillaria novae-zelandiae]
MSTVANPDWNSQQGCILEFRCSSSYLKPVEKLRPSGNASILLKQSALNVAVNASIQPVGFPGQLGMQPHEWQTDLTTRLQTSEMGLNKAKEECNKLEESLTAANAEMAFVKKLHLPTVLRNNYAAQAFPHNATAPNMGSNINGHWPLDGRPAPELLATIQAQDAEIKTLQETVNKERSVNTQLEQKLAAVVLHATGNPNRNPGAEKEATLPIDRQSSTRTLRPKKSLLTTLDDATSSNNTTSYVTDIPDDRQKTLRDFDIGLGVDKDTFVGKGEFYTLFVGIKEGPARRFRYLGRYTATHVEPLTVAEWNTLAPSVQSTYSETTKKKTKDTRPTERIKSLYDEGVLAVPCVLLKYVDFDYELSSSLELALP